MATNIVSLSAPVKKPSIAQIECSQCGATADAACNCGAPYVPKAIRATEAITKNPEKSSRAIAEEIGVDEKTVRKARKATADKSAVEKRVGKDGKVRKLPAKNPKLTGEKDLCARVSARFNDIVAGLVDGAAAIEEIAKTAEVNEVATSEQPATVTEESLTAQPISARKLSAARDPVLELYFGSASGSDIYRRIPLDNRTEVIRDFLDALGVSGMQAAMSPDFERELRGRVLAKTKRSKSDKPKKFKTLELVKTTTASGEPVFAQPRGKPARH